MEDSSRLLLAELENILALVRRNCPQAGQAGARLALVRLVRGISLAQWQRIAANTHAPQWLALPLDQSALQILQTLQDSQETLSYQSDHDPLTRLANRRLLDRQLTLEMERAVRTQTSMSLVILDLDDFKQVNDTYGHACGDTVLVHLGQTMRHSLRPYDLAARIGGEEFCLILPGASAPRAQNLTRRLLAAFSRQTFTVPSGAQFSVTFSAGVATLVPQNRLMDAATLMALADEAMYSAKRQGKNQVLIATGMPSALERTTHVHAAEKKFLFFGSA